MPNSLTFYAISMVATFLSVMFMTFVTAWTILDILTFNLSQ